MGNIVENYKITKGTIAILPAKQIEFSSYLLERESTKRVKKTPLQIIQQACLDHDWCDFEGRRKAVAYHTGFKQKIPIPISLHKGIIAFPTHAIKAFECCWIFVDHILKIEKQKEDKRKSIIHFRNRHPVIINVSIHILKKQKRRTLECKYKMMKSILSRYMTYVKRL